ncbi:MAG: hypothetical protein IJ866_02640 [Alphaproteobacteria bacterium]|nr:hypothetical protein [Alphaproteobacteria bacterium]
MPNKNWFEQNMHAVYGDSPFSACSFCSMRNLEKFCNLLRPSCNYCSTDGSVFGAVTWMPNDSSITRQMEMCLPPREMVSWFNKTSPDDIKNVAMKMAHHAVVASRKSR